MSKLRSLSPSYPISQEPAVYVIHENDEWVKPLRKAFEQFKVPFVEWFVDSGKIDLDEVPPQGIFYNRMSASSHTRSHRFAAEITGPLLAWLQLHGRKVINDRRALQLEIRKFEQYLELRKYGIKTPATIAASGKEQIVQAARQLGSAPFILKPNRGGKGQGVRLFNTLEELEGVLRETDDQSLDGISLIQEYVRPQEGYITRLEFIGGKFYYAVKVDASGGFELCPADGCQAGDAFCPTSEEAGGNKFEVDTSFTDDVLIGKLEKFFEANGMRVAAAEFVQNERGERFVYDININTNYNQAAEKRAGNSKQGMTQIARFLKKELQNEYFGVSSLAI